MTHPRPEVPELPKAVEDAIQAFASTLTQGGDMWVGFGDDLRAAIRTALANARDDGVEALREFGMNLCDIITQDAGLGFYATTVRERLVARALAATGRGRA